MRSLKLIMLLMMVCACSCHRKQAAPSVNIAKNITVQIDQFSQFLNIRFLPALKNDHTSDAEIRGLFLALRLKYKAFEWASAYFTPGPDRLINGPPVAEVERSGQIKEPGGLQVMEGLLFPVTNDKSRSGLLQQAGVLSKSTLQCKLYFSHISLFDWQIWEASRMEVFRVLCLGLSGFDSPEGKNNMAESATALQTLTHNLALYGNKNLPVIDSATAYLARHQGFDSFDRAFFISHYGNPLSAALLGRQESLHIKPMHYTRLLNQNAKTLFDERAFNSYAFADNPSLQIDPKAVQLGERLFHDTRLSGSMTRSCASCHQPSQFFSDGLPVNTVIDGNEKLPRRTPTLINAALQPAQFADMRAVTLEQQVTDVIGSAREMHGNLSADSARIANDTVYGSRPLSTKNMVYYLAAYVRSLSYLNSRFDRFMRGERAVLNQQEIAGFNLFMGKGKCGSCHYMPLFNGAFPPFFDRMDAEVIGVPGRNGSLDADLGQFRIIPAAPLAHAFKTPTVRNSSRFAFYMHNGKFSSLKEVLDFYNKGGGQGHGLAVPNQTLSPAPLHLNKSECTAIIAFIGSLNSRLPVNSKKL